jgi:hypothetical protein
MMTPLFASAAATGFGAGGVLLAALAFALFAGVLGMATAHNPVPQLSLASTNTTIALTEFKLQMLEKLSKYELPMMTALGAQDVSNMLETRYPINVGDPVFKSLVADNPEFLRLGEIFFELYTEPFQAAAVESAARLRTAEWARRGWGSLPGKFAAALRSLFERLLAGSSTATPLNPVAGGFKGGESTPSCENLNGGTSIKVFQTGHPVNPLDTSKGVYDNLYTGAAVGTGEGTTADKNADGSTTNNYPGALPLNVDSVRIIRNLFGTQLGPNGVDPRGYDLTHIVCGKDLEETLLTLVKDDVLLVNSSNTTPAAADSPLVLRPNPLKKYRPIVPVVNPFLNEPGVWYPCSADDDGELPWMTLVKVPNNPGQVPGMPGPGIVMADGIEWKIWNELSTLYLEGSKLGPAGSVAVAALVEAAAGITLPWRIKRCKAT